MISAAEMKRILVLALIPAAAALPVTAGEWHAGTTYVCTGCHVIHSSRTHNWDGTTPVPATAQPNINWPEGQLALVAQAGEQNHLAEQIRKEDES
jgi:hypothetical protein